MQFCRGSDDCAPGERQRRNRFRGGCRAVFAIVRGIHSLCKTICFSESFRVITLDSSSFRKFGICAFLRMTAGVGSAVSVQKMGCFLGREYAIIKIFYYLNI